jgi:OmpA-OmpF porin, OOP family
MHFTHVPNGWRWLGLIIILIILLLLSLMGFGPTMSDSLTGCCGVSVAQQTPELAPSTSSVKKINFGIRDDSGKVTLTGVLPNEDEKQNVLNFANGVYGDGNFIDQLTVTSNAALPHWWQNINRALIWLKCNTGFSLSQLADVITLTGMVPNEAAKTVKEGEVRAFFAGTTKINNLLTLGTPEPALAVNPTPVVPPCSKNMNVVISFQSNSAVLSEKGKKQLDQITKCIASPTEVGGHTDSGGDDVYNKRLSKARAEAVIAYIKSIDEAKGKLLTAVGYGESKPIADNAIEDGKAQNRRIEFIAK